MAEPAKRRTARRRPWWRRSALPRSRSALALGAVVAVVLLILLLLGVTRARPGRDVPAYDPATASTTATRLPVPPPSVTSRTTVATTPATTPAPAKTTTTRHRP